MGISVLLRFLISSNEVCTTAYARSAMEQSRWLWQKKAYTLTATANSKKKKKKKDHRLSWSNVGETRTQYQAQWVCICHTYKYVTRVTYAYVAVRYMIHFYCIAVEAGRVLDFESGGPGSIPGRGKCDLDFFSFPITFGGQCGGGSLGAWWAKQVLGCHSELARHLYWHECIQMSRYRKEGCSS